VIEKLIGDTIDWDYSEYDIVIVEEGEEPSLFKQFLEKVNADDKEGNRWQRGDGDGDRP